MSFDLEPFNPGPLVRAADAAAAPTSVSTTGLNFTSVSGASDPLPPQVAPPAPGVVAHSVEEFDEAFTHHDGRLCTVQVAWRAYLNQIQVYWIHKPLAGEKNKRPGAAEVPYLHEQRIFVPTAPVSRTTGVVAPDVTMVTDKPAYTAVPASTPDAFRGGATATATLPSAVQLGMSTHVPVPALWSGVVSQRRSEGEPYSQAVNVLRMDENAAVALHATRERRTTGAAPRQAAEELAALPWVITQVTYDLRTPAHVEPASSGRRLLGWRKQR